MTWFERATGFPLWSLIAGAVVIWFWLWVLGAFA